MVAILGGTVLAAPATAATGPTVQLAVDLADPLNRSNTFGFTLTNPTAGTDSIAATAGATETSPTIATATAATDSVVTVTSATGDPIADYSASIDCADSAGGSDLDVTGTSVTIPAGVMTSADNWLCTFTITRLSTTLDVGVAFPAGGVTGDTVSDSTTGFLNNQASGPFTEANGAVPDSFSGTDTVAHETVYAGETGQLVQNVTVGNPHDFVTTYSCAYGGTGSPTGLVGNTLTINPADASPKTVNCFINDTFTHATLALIEKWAPGASAGDQATVAGTGFSTNPTVSGTAASAGNSVQGAAVDVGAGDTGTIGATFTSGSAANYVASLSCTGSSNAPVGDALTISAADATAQAAIVCTELLTPKTATLTLVKQWAPNSKTGDTATVSSSGFVNDATSGPSVAQAAGNSDSGTAVTVTAGESGTIGETFSIGSASNYAASLSCVGNADPLTGNTLTISAADTAITCTETNTRNSASLVLAKQWASGSIAGDTATVTTSGFSTEASSGASVAQAGGNTDQGTSVTVFAGDSATIGETYSVGSPASYTSSLACTGTSGLAGTTLTVGAADTAIVCTETNTPGPAPFFVQAKTSDLSTYIVGQSITYTITVTNTGGASGSATVTDPVPAIVSVSAVTCTPSVGSSCLPGPQTNSVAGSVALLANGIATFLVTGTVNAPGTLTNTAAVTTTTVGCSTQCGGGPASTPALTATTSGGGSTPFLTEAKSANRSSFVVGQAITYTISVGNTGTAAGAATVTDPVPSIVTVSSVTCTTSAGGACTPGPQTNAMAGTVSLPASGTASFLVAGTVTAAGTLTNTATVAATTAGCTTQCGGGPATTPALSATTSGGGGTSTPADLSVTKTLDQPAITAGAPITYLAVTSNSGPNPSVGVVTLDPVSAVIENPTGSPDPAVSGATCATRPSTPADLARLNPAYGPYTTATYPNVVECDYPVIAVGQTVTDTITGTVDAALVAGSSIVNQEVVFAQTYDPNLSNNVTAAVGPASVTSSSLAVTQTTTTGTVDVGGSATITIVVTNNGPSNASGVVLSDLPTGLTTASANPSTGSYDPSGSTWTIGALAAGASVTLILVETVTGTSATNQACAAGTGTSTSCSPTLSLLVESPTALAFTGTDAAPDLAIAIVLLILGGLCLLVGTVVRRRLRAVGHWDRR